MNAKGSFDERRRLVAQSLQVGNPVNNARELGAQADPRQECQLELSLEDVRPYEHNPRRSRNPRFDEIKESIRTGGLRSPLTVTRRPADEHYIVEAGGNTRLTALRQLWAETRDPRYSRLTVLYRPWKSDSHVLTAHLIENEQRGEMSFWDKATGIVALKSRLEAEQGRALTLRPLEDELHALGLSVTTTTLGLYLFATDRLSILGEGLPRLTGLDVKTLQPRLNALKRQAQSLTGIDEGALYEQVFDPVFRRFVNGRIGEGGVRIARLIEACEEALAAHLGLSVAALRAGAEARDPSAEPVEEEPAESGLDVPESPSLAMGRTPSALRTFAAAVGLEHCLQHDEQGAGEVQLTQLDASAMEDPRRRRAWWWMASVADQCTQAAAEQAPAASDLLAWLKEPSDPSAQAAIELLIGHRESQAPRPVDGLQEGG